MIKNLLELRKGTESSHDQKELEQIDAELWLLNGPLEGDVWKWCLDNINKPYPKWKKEWVPIVIERLKTSQASFPRAKYLYALWTLTKNINYAKESLMFFIKAGDLHVHEITYMMTWGFCYRMALTLATTLDIDLLQTIEAIIKTCESEAKENRKIASRLLQILADYAVTSHRILKRTEIKDLFEKTIPVGEEMIEEYQRVGEFVEEQNALEYLVKIFRSAGDYEAADNSKMREASSLERQAESTQSNLLKSSFLQSALNIYVEMGKSEKIEELKRRVHEATVQSMKEFKRIEVKIEIPNKVIEDLVASYATLPPIDALVKITYDETFIPKVDHVKKEVDELRERHLVSSLFPVEICDNDLPRRTIIADDERIGYEVDKRFLLEANVRMMFLDRLLDVLKTGALTKDSIIHYLDGKKNIDPESLALIDNALGLFFSKNYVGATHILVCRIEAILRNLLENHGITATKYDSEEKGMDYSLLGGLIADAEQFIGDNMTEFLEVKLTQKGENIRNNICHGFIKPESFNEDLANTLLFIILKLSDI